MIVPGLAQGGCPSVGPWVRAYGFDTLVLAAEEYQPSAESFPGVRVVHVPLDDAVPTERDKRAISAAGHFVAVEVSRGHRVLVTCQAGRNRSGIIVAVALRHLYRAPYGDIVGRIRHKRMPTALSNRHFELALRRGELDGDLTKRVVSP